MTRYTVLLVAGCLFAGCVPGEVENQDDMRNWDFTACLDELDTCPGLLLDNQEVILGGHTFVEILVVQLTVGSFEGEWWSTLLPPPTADAPDPVRIGSWDFSQCLKSFDDFNVCKDLFFDNADLILGGQNFVEILVTGEFAPVELPFAPAE